MFNDPKSFLLETILSNDTATFNYVPRDNGNANLNLNLLPSNN